MKYFLMLLMFVSSAGFAGDDLLGYWYNKENKEDYTAIIKIEKDQNTNEYYGSIYQLRNPLYTEGEYEGQKKRDLNNKEPSLRDRELVGIRIIEHFKYDEKNKDYRDGVIYNPEDGKTYYSYIRFKNKDLLFVKGSIDVFGFIGKTNVWSRVTESLK